MRTVAVLILGFIGAAAAQHTPGRVGGSINNPSLSPRPSGSRPAPPPPRAALSLQNLSLDEQSDFTAASNKLPGLTLQDFLQLRYLTAALREEKVETTTADLAQAVHEEHNHVASAIQKLAEQHSVKLTRSRVHDMYLRTRDQAKNRIAALAK